MNSLWSVGVVVSIVVWCLIGLSVHMTSTPPYEPLGGDTATRVVPYMGEVIVTRNFRITRAVPMIVARSAVSGVCEKTPSRRPGCEIIELASGELNLEPGEYTISKPHTLLSSVKPGRWRLAFNIRWTGAFGIVYATQLPDLDIEVTP